MILTMISKRKIFLLIVNFCSIMYGKDISNNYDKYIKRVITKDCYQHTKNWDAIVKDGKKLYIYYKTDEISNTSFITDLLYILKYKDGTIVEIGGFNQTKGFYNKEKKYFLSTKTVDPKNDFMMKKLKGLSMDTLDNPFFPHGLAVDKTNNIYETDLLGMFEIDDKNETLIEWSPW